MYQVHLRKAESAGKKAEEKAAKEAADAEARDKNLAEAKKVVLEEDKSLPAAQKCKIRDAKPFRDQRIKVDGWIHRLRRQENDQNNHPQKINCSTMSFLIIHRVKILCLLNCAMVPDFCKLF